MEKANKWGTPTHKYYGMNREEIKALWDANGKATSEASTSFYFLCEYYCNGWRGLRTNPIYMARPEVRQFLKYYDEEITGKGLIPFRTKHQIVLHHC